tara:strand:- start:190 stop:681 length:492 start_codon:yes stop_codon:yes gene_type:complete
MKKRIEIIGSLEPFVSFRQSLVVGIGIILTTAAVLFSFPKRVNAATTILSCNVESYGKQTKENNWKVMKTTIWNLEINQSKKLIVWRWNPIFEGKSYSFKKDYKILKNYNNYILAISNDMTSPKGGISFNSLSLDLNSGQLVFANIINDSRGYAFANQYGICK